MNTVKENVKKRACLFLRRSTDMQETTRQRNELLEVCIKKDYEVISVIDESESGAVAEDERVALKQIRGMVENKEIDIVLCMEISRIARVNSVCHSFLEFLIDHSVDLYWHSQRLHMLLPSEDGEKPKRNPVASLLYSYLSEQSRSELEILKSRVVSGIKAYREKNDGDWGRRKGSKVPVNILLEKHSDVVRKLKQGFSVRNTSAITQKGVSTVQRIRKLLKEEGLVS